MWVLLLNYYDTTSAADIRYIDSASSYVPHEENLSSTVLPEQDADRPKNKLAESHQLLSSDAS